MSYQITLKLTAEQYEWLDRAAKAIEEVDGPVSHGTVMMLLMERGLPVFESQFKVPGKPSKPKLILLRTHSSK